MFPGFTTRLSHKVVPQAASLVADADVLFLSGSAISLANLLPKVPNSKGQVQIVFLVPLNASLVTTTTGNITTGTTTVVNRVAMLLWNPTTQKWVTNAVATV